MSFKDLDIKFSYISFGDENIASSFLVPALKCAKRYRRSVGFFSSSVFSQIIDGIVVLSRNKGKIEIIASPQLTEEDRQAIELGYQKRDEIVQSVFTKAFIDEIDCFDDEKLKLLAALIANGTLDIKIAVTESSGIYHDKLGILDDFDGNTLVFYGSANETESGYKNNYEKIRVVKGWISSNQENVVDECNEFQSLWDDNNKFVKVYDYGKIAKKNILEVVESRRQNHDRYNLMPIKLFDYQEEAISAWIKNSYNGFYVMATGTGKTWTAIFSAKKLVEKTPALIVVCAPYKHLVKQWSEDIQIAFPEAKIILVSSENIYWESQIKEEFIRKKYYKNNQIIIISTIASFMSSRFAETINNSQEEKMLIVDEAHRFTNRSATISSVYKYKLGLSATPFSGISAEKGLELMKWFGGMVFNLPIEKALEKGFLVKYNYYPIYVTATESDEQKFNIYTRQIISCFKNGVCINHDQLVRSVRNRLRTISMAQEKNTRINEIINKVLEKDHIVVYCGDGKLYDKDSEGEERHIRYIKRILSEHGYRSSQFTASESMNERVALVDAFNNGEISALAAIRCLDEGINIPSIKSALILSSNDDYREFVQRRGRILRKYSGKEYANIYDVIVLPQSQDMDTWARIELRRFYEYARLATNWPNLEKELKEHLSSYGLTIDDVDVYDFYEVEDEIDE